MLRLARERFDKFQRLLEAFNRRTARAEIERYHDRLQRSDPESLAFSGYSVYSQGDEDGILDEILRRLGITYGTFLEIGVGDGLQNNTAYLLAKRDGTVLADANARQISQIRRGLASLVARRQLKIFDMLVGPEKRREVEGQFLAQNTRLMSSPSTSTVWTCMSLRNYSRIEVSPQGRDRRV